MHDILRLQLGAYLDGALDERSQALINAHLPTCPDCQQELAALRQLSALLHAAPMPAITPVNDFRANLLLRLPRRAVEAPPSARGWHVLPWLAPLVALAGWLLMQVVFNFAGLLALTDQTGLLAGLLARFVSGPQEMTWFAAAQAALGGWLNPSIQAGLLVLNRVGVFTYQIALGLLWQVVAAALYWCALTLVWHYKVKALWQRTTA